MPHPPTSDRVTIYVSTYCGFCGAAKRYLSSMGVAFDTVDASDDPEMRRWLMETTGLRTVPQIFIGDKGIGGFQEMRALDNAWLDARVHTRDEHLAAIDVND